MRPHDPSFTGSRSSWAGERAGDGRRAQLGVGAPLFFLLLVSLAGCQQPSNHEPACSPATQTAEAAGFLLQVCADEPAASTPAAARAPSSLRPPWRRVQDQRTGRWVDLAEPPRRVVSQTLATDEVLADLLTVQERPRLVAVSAFAASPRYSDLGDFAAAVGTTVTNKTEEILALRPDLVFAASYSTTETVQQLESAGVPVIVLHRFHSVDAIRDNLRVIAFALGLDDDGRRLEQELEENVARASEQVRQTIEGSSPKAVAYGSGSAHAAGTLMDDLILRFGLRNPASDAGLEAWPSVTEEHLIDWQPDVVFLSAPNDREDRVATLFRSRFSKLSSAAAAPRLVMVPETSWSTVSHRVGDLALQMAEGFVDVDPAVDATDDSRGERVAPRD